MVPAKITKFTGKTSMHNLVLFVDKYPILAVVEEINDYDEAIRN